MDWIIDTTLSDNKSVSLDSLDLLVFSQFFLFFSSTAPINLNYFHLQNLWKSENKKSPKTDINNSKVSEQFLVIDKFISDLENEFSLKNGNYCSEKILKAFQSRSLPIHHQFFRRRNFDRTTIRCQYSERR